MTSVWPLGHAEVPFFVAIFKCEYRVQSPSMGFKFLSKRNNAMMKRNNAMMNATPRRGSICQVRLAGMCLASVLSVGRASAETYYLTSTETSKSYGALSDGAKWKTAGGQAGESGALDEASTYVVKDDKWLCFRNNANATFGGKRLELGVSGDTSGSALLYVTPTFENEGVFLNKGSFSQQGSDGSVFTFSGPLTVMSSESAPFAMTYSYTGASTVFAGKLTCAADCVFQVGGKSQKGTGYASRNTVRLTGDCSQYLGTLSLVAHTQFTEAASAGSWCVKALFGVDFPGTVSVARGCAVGRTAATGTVTLGALTLAGGSMIAAAYDIASNVSGPLTVSGSCTKTGDEAIAIAAPGTARGDVSVLTVPLTSPLTESDFVLDATDATLAQTRSFTFRENAEAGTKTLVVTYSPVPMIYQTKAESTVGTSESWSDGTTAMTEGNHYWLYPALADGAPGTLSMNLSADVTDTTLPGASLTLVNSSLWFTRFKSEQQYLRFKTLKMLNGSTLFSCNQVYVNLIGDELVIDGTCKFGSCSGRTFKFNTLVKGRGCLQFCSRSNASSVPYGICQFLKPNPDYLGRIELFMSQSGHAEYATKHQTLELASDWRELGGALSAFEPKALVLRHYSRLKSTSASMTIPSASNRGIYINGEGLVNVPASKALRIETPVAVNGHLWKEGAGTLSLCAAAAFGTDALATEPTEGLNLFTVTNGTVRVCGADALNGLRTDFAAGTALKLAVDLDNADLTRYGIRVAKSGATPFSLPEGVTQLPLSIEKADEAQKPASATFTLGILTVDPEAYASAKAMLPAFPRLFTGYGIVATEITNDDGTVTFAQTYTRRGVTLTLR